MEIDIAMRGDRMNLRHVRAIAEIGRTGSVTRASAMAHMSQPAITQALAKTEADLGARLFHRSSKGMTPTAAGTEFVRRAHRALELLDRGATRAGWRRGARFDAVVTATQLRALIAVAAHGSYSVAARVTGVAQPALHRAARDFERVTGLDVFLATPEGVRTSAAAGHLTMAARLAFAELDQAIAEVAELAAGPGRGPARIRIGSMPLSRSAILPRVIIRFAERRPDVALQVIDGPYDDLLYGLRHGEIDLVVGALRDPAPTADVRQVPLFHDRLGVFCDPAHALAGSAPALAELADMPWVAPRRGTPTRDHFDNAFRAHGLTPPERVTETSSIELVERLLTSGRWLTVISRRQVWDLVVKGRLVALPVALGDPPRLIGWTCRDTWEPTAAQAMFLDLLRRGDT